VQQFVTYGDRIAGPVIGGSGMNRLTMFTLALVLTVNATAARKTMLKDLQPVGVTDEKHKNQQ
jgi:hypothetical protein